jgi:hypothetical protein
MMNISHKLAVCIATTTLSLATVIANPQVAKSITLESATLGSLSGLPGVLINELQFLGWRFQVNNTLQVTDIGGHFTGEGAGELFGTIVPLPNPNAFPQVLPRELEKISLAATTFSIPSSGDTNEKSVVFLTPLSVTLNPGNYALIFGSGLFGAEFATETMPFPDDQKAFPSTSYFFADDASIWKELTDTDLYFVVKGELGSSTSIPENSSTFYLLVIGALGTNLILKKHSKR